MLHQHEDTCKQNFDMAERMLYALGRDIFARGGSIDECATVPERKGYLAALYAAADADTSAYLVGQERLS